MHVKLIRYIHMLNIWFRQGGVAISKLLVFQIANCRSSHWRCSVRKGIRRNFAKFTGNSQVARVSFLIKLQAY